MALLSRQFKLISTILHFSDLQGELALAFGDLLRKLWSSGRTAVAPRAFKGKLARFAPQFSGYNQHDSQVSFCKLHNFGFWECSQVNKP